jgi:DNA-directed RNA polymerase subunit RPC12/RpoP
MSEFCMDKIRRWVKRARPYLVTRARRLPWLRCRHCGRRLVEIDVIDGHTCIRIGAGTSRHVYIECRRCGEEREFVGMRIDLR